MTATNLQPIPYLSFDGKCREAMHFYEKTLGGTIRVMMSGADSPMAGQIPSEFADRILNAQLELPGGAMLYAGDAPAHMPYEGIKGISIALNYSTVEAAEAVFNALAIGGTVTMPYSPTFWAKKFGMLVDRFGIHWIINGELTPLPQPDSLREPMTKSDLMLIDSQIQLRPVVESDLPTLFEHQREPEANRMAAFPARNYDAFMAHWNKLLADKALVAMTVIFDNCIAGNIGSWTQDGVRQVGYWIGKEHWGKGIATQALSMLLRVVTDRPIHAYVAKHNIASVRVLEKCGFLLNEELTSALGPSPDGIEELVYVNDSLAWDGMPRKNT